MKPILFASDLDNTLLFSHRHRQPGDRCVERLDEAEQGFFTQETLDLLPQAARRVHLLPVTTRSMEQYLRIQWPEGAVPRGPSPPTGPSCCGRRVGPGLVRAVPGDDPGVSGGAPRILRFLSARPEPSTVRMVEGMYVYAACPDPAAAERCGADWDPGSPIRAVVSGRKAYFFPPGVDKGTALRRAVERFRPERVIAAGDSVIDVPMLRRADLALLPGPELLPQLPGARVCGPGRRFPTSCWRRSSGRPPRRRLDFFRESSYTGPINKKGRHIP